MVVDTVINARIGWGTESGDALGEKPGIAGESPLTDRWSPTSMHSFTAPFDS